MLNFPTKTINYIKDLLQRQQRDVEKNLKEVSEDDPVKADSSATICKPFSAALSKNLS